MRRAEESPAEAVAKMSAKKIVQALDNSPARMLDLVHDGNTGQYFAPYNPSHAQFASLHKAGITGKGVTSAILDTGVLSDHPLLRGKIVDSVDFTGEGPEDLNGHGTVVALILLATAPGSRILNVKVLDQSKQGLEDDLVAGLEWAASHGAMIINLSLGIEREQRCDGTCAVCRATQRLVRDLHVIVVAAAGNRPDRFYCPASGGDAISVGATDYTGTRIADYSAAAKIYAPGRVIMVPVETTSSGWLTRLLKKFRARRA